MTMTRFVPFRSNLSDVALLQNRLNSIFQDFARTDAAASETLGTGNFVPPADIHEDAQNLVLALEVPGIAPADLDIRIEGRTLTVRGERKLSAEHKDENVHRIERSFGTFVRSWTLPASVDTESIDATTENGVLTLKLAKKPAAQPRQIPVKAAAPAPEAPRQVEASTTQE